MGNDLLPYAVCIESLKFMLFVDAENGIMKNPTTRPKSFKVVNWIKQKKKIRKVCKSDAPEELASSTAYNRYVGM